METDGNIIDTYSCPIKLAQDALNYCQTMVVFATKEAWHDTDDYFFNLKVLGAYQNALDKIKSKS